eukprot:UN29991
MSSRDLFFDFDLASGSWASSFFSWSFWLSFSSFLSSGLASDSSTAASGSTTFGAVASSTGFSSVSTAGLSLSSSANASLHF